METGPFSSWETELVMMVFGSNDVNELLFNQPIIYNDDNKNNLTEDGKHMERYECIMEDLSGRIKQAMATDFIFMQIVQLAGLFPTQMCSPSWSDSKLKTHKHEFIHLGFDYSNTPVISITFLDESTQDEKDEIVEFILSAVHKIFKCDFSRTTDNGTTTFETHIKGWTYNGTDFESDLRITMQDTLGCEETVTTVEREPRYWETVGTQIINGKVYREIEDLKVVDNDIVKVDTVRKYNCAGKQ